MQAATMSTPVVKRRVLLVDDHPLLRYGLSALVNYQPDLMICGEAATPSDAVHAAATFNPDLIVLDISLEGGDGLELCKQLHASHPKIPILILSMHDEQFYAEPSLHAGAMGFVMKQQAHGEVLDAMRRVLLGQTAVSETISTRILRSIADGTSAAKTDSPLDRLSNRELEVFRLVGAGQSVASIAQMLYLSPKTVEAHKERIKQKLQLSSNNELLQYAIAARTN